MKISNSNLYFYPHIISHISSAVQHPWLASQTQFNIPGQHLRLFYKHDSINPPLTFIQDQAESISDAQDGSSCLMTKFTPIKPLSFVLHCIDGKIDLLVIPKYTKLFFEFLGDQKKAHREKKVVTSYHLYKMKMCHTCLIPRYD